MAISDRCDSCGKTKDELPSRSTKLIKVPALDMVLCDREYQYWKKNGVLKPVRRGR